MTRPCLGPLENPSAPQHTLPPGACDCHAHVIAPQEVQPFVPERDYTPPPASLEAYKAMHKVLGIERAVIVQPSFYGTDNTVTLDAIRDYGPSCRGVAVVDDSITDAELEAMHERGIRGIRYNLVFAGGVGPENIERMAQRIRPLGWHVQLLVNGPTIAELEQQIAGLPVPAVVDHMGHVKAAEGLEQPGFQALLRLVGAGKAWVKLSGNYRISAMREDYTDAIPFARALVAEAPEHMVWGTDWPHPALYETMPDDGKLLDALFTYCDEATARRILVDNPAELYGF